MLATTTVCTTGVATVFSSFFSVDELSLLVAEDTVCVAEVLEDAGVVPEVMLPDEVSLEDEVPLEVVLSGVLTGAAVVDVKVTLWVVDA